MAPARPRASFSRRRLLAVAPAWALPARGFARPGPPPVVTLLGDSITAGYGLAPAQALPARLQAALDRLRVPARVRGAGVFGDTAEGGAERVDRDVASDTAVAVVLLGANDVLLSVPPARTERALRLIVRRLKARRIGVVLGGGRNPFRRDPAFDAVFARVAAAEGVPLAPDLLRGVAEVPAMLQPDGLHPNARGADRVALRLAPVVAAALRARRAAA
jgi:acyl-CoA thioesterase I